MLDASGITTEGVDVVLSGSEDGYVASLQRRANFVEIEQFVLTAQNDSLDSRNADTPVIASSSSGDDTLQGGSGADTLTGGAGNDFIDGGVGNDSVIGGLGGDTISGGDGDDYIDGCEGEDLLRTGAGQDTLMGGDGNDTLLNSVGYDSLVGGAGDDSIVATWGADTLEGGVGDNTLIGGADDDSVEGGAGEDLIFSGSRNIAANYIQQTGASDNFTGTNGNTSFFGTTTSSDGDLTAKAVGGLDGYALGDGDGVETHTHSFSQEVVGIRVDFNALNLNEDLGFAIDGASVNLNDLIANGDAIFDGGGSYEVAGTGRIILSSGGNVVQIGSVTFLRPLTTIDVDTTEFPSSGGVIYELHVDTNPPTASDVDFLSGGDDADTFILEDAFGNDTIAGGEGTTTGIDSDTIDGSPVATDMDVTFSGDEAGTITSRGDDSLVSGTGNDTIIGDAGNDTAFGGDGADQIYDASGENVFSGGEGNDSIFGGSDSDTITGDAGDDRIVGNEGDDSLSSGSGNDNLSGGGGNDTFGYTPGDGLDTITDFNAGNTGRLDDGDNTNNDFVDLSSYYNDIWELYADQADDKVLNQLNTTKLSGSAVDYSDNTQSDTDATPNNEGIAFSGASADSSSFTAENTGVVCFTSGTAIRTPRGDVLIDALRIGNLVSTMDNGAKRIRWIGRSSFGAEALQANPKLRPVMIRKGVMGAERNLLVSPQHALLLDRALVRATHLVNIAGLPVRVAHGKKHVTYTHLMFDDHEVIFAENVATESFYLGPMALSMMDPDKRFEMMLIFPEIARNILGYNVASAYCPPARRVLKRKEIPLNAAGVFAPPNGKRVASIGMA